MKIFKPYEFGVLIGVSIKTLHRWDASGKLKAKRTLGNHRYYTEEDLIAYQKFSESG